MASIRPVNIQEWSATIRQRRRPPGGNKVMCLDGGVIVMGVGGTNSRKDFHVDPAEEFFQQIEGDMLLRIVENGRIVDVPIRAGEMLLLPPRVPHSPQRYPDTVGLVIEGRRPAGALDGLQWYCERCERLLYEEFFVLTNIETQFPPVFDRFFGSLERRTCKHCGHVMEAPPAPGPPAAAKEFPHP